MKESIRKEFEQRAIDFANDGILVHENKEEWGFYLFNEDYYVIGYTRSMTWLTMHNVSVFEAIGVIQDYDTIEVDYSDAERVVNAYTYILGMEWISDGGEEFIQNYIN